MNHFKPYIKYLSRNKLYTAVSLIGLAVALMFITILFRYVERENSVDSFHANKERIFMLCGGDDGTVGIVSAPIPQQIQDFLPEIEAYCRIAEVDVSMKKGGSEMPISAKVLGADSSFFTMFSFPLIEGTAKGVLESPQSIVLSQSMARKLLPEGYQLGQEIVLGLTSYTLSGIMADLPYNTQFGHYDAIAPFRTIVIDRWGEQTYNNIGSCNYGAYYLVREGADIHAKEDLLFDKLNETFFPYQMGFRTSHSFIKLQDLYFSPNSSSGNFNPNRGDRSRINLLLAIGLLVLLMASVNYIGMSAAQAGPRSREVALKKLLGSSRIAIIWQYLSESFIMTFMAAALGVGLAFMAEKFFVNSLGVELELAKAFAQPAVLLLTFGFVILLSLLAGIVPALITSRVSSIEVVRGSFRRRIKARYSSILMGLQYTIAIALLIGSGIVILQTRFLINAPLGFRSDSLLVVKVNADSTMRAQTTEYLRQNPYVEDFSYSRGSPFGSSNNQSGVRNGVSISLNEIGIDTAFVRLYQIPITDASGENRKPRTGTPVKIDDYPLWLDQNTLKILEPDPKTGEFELYEWQKEAGYRYRYQGSFPNLRIRPLTEEQPNLYFYDLGDWTPSYLTISLKPGADLYENRDAIEEVLRRQWENPLIDLQVSDEIIRENYRPFMQLARLISVFAILSLLIATMGVFAMSVYLMEQRQREVALRRVSGAKLIDVLLIVAKGTRWPLAIASVLATLVAFFISQRWLLQYPLHIAQPWWLYLLVSLLVAALALFFVSVLTLRMAKDNPVKYLKSE